MKNTFLDYKVFAQPDISQMHTLFSGENNKHTFVAYKDVHNEQLNTFLTRIMASVQVNLEKDCLILRGADIETIPTFAQISSNYTIKNAILFGISPKELHLNIDAPLYMPFKVNNTTLLFADPLAHITTDATKRALWDCLKLIFV